MKCPAVPLRRRLDIEFGSQRTNANADMLAQTVPRGSSDMRCCRALRSIRSSACPPQSRRNAQNGATRPRGEGSPIQRVLRRRPAGGGFRDESRLPTNASIAGTIDPLDVLRARVEALRAEEGSARRARTRPSAARAQGSAATRSKLSREDAPIPSSDRTMIAAVAKADVYRRRLVPAARGSVPVNVSTPAAGPLERDCPKPLLSTHVLADVCIPAPRLAADGSGEITRAHRQGPRLSPRLVQGA